MSPPACRSVWSRSRRASRPQRPRNPVGCRVGSRARVRAHTQKEVVSRMSYAVGSLKALRATDPAVFDAIRAEEKRQREKLLLIASENFASPAVLAAQGCLMTNKYAEGYPGRRYYGGCENVDVVEELAIQRAKQIFGADHVNVQPHSGSQANMAAYLSVLKPGDAVLGMDLSQGGHLTHGSRVNFSGNLFKSHFY